MTNERLHFIWRFLCTMKNTTEYGHIFTGASVDTMMRYVNHWRGRIGTGPISKAEVKAALRWAIAKGWLEKIPRSINGWQKLPSAYKFTKGA